MAKQTAQSSLLAKLGDRGRRAFDKHKGDETVFSGAGDLPAGIEGGIARLVDCKFDVYKKGDTEGELYFYAAGVVVSPRVHGDVRIEGLRTSIMEPLCETSGRSRETVEDHMTWILNELRKLGVETDGVEYSDLEAIVAALKEQQPYFRFRTWKGQKQTTGKYAGQEPRTQHTWNGVCDYEDDNTDPGAAVEEDEGSTPPPLKPAKTIKGEGPNGQSAKAPTTTTKNVSYDTALQNAKSAGSIRKASSFVEDEEETSTEAEDGFNEFEDLDNLISLAEAGDDNAQQKLRDMAEAAGATDEDIDAADDWQAVADFVTKMQTAESSVEEDSVEKYTPQVGEVVSYRPTDPKTKKPSTKAVECEVIEVKAKARLVKLRNLANSKLTYEGVRWDTLIIE